MRKLLWPLGLAAFAFSPVPLAAPTTAAPLAAPTTAAPISAQMTPAPLAAQTDFRNLDEGRPTHTEDALPVDRYGFELVLPYALEAEDETRLNLTLEGTRPDTRTSTATVDIPLELGGQRGARMTAAQRARDVAAAELARTRAEFRSRVTEAYFAVLIAQERSALAANAVALASRGADAVARRATAGKASPVEATRAGVDLAQVQLEAAEATATLERARFALAALLGEGEPPFDRVSGEVADAPSRAPLAELAARLDDSPTLATTRREVERRRALADVERTKALPDVTLSLGSKRDNELGRSQAVIGVSIPLPLFDRNQGAIREANRRADKAGDELQEARQRLVVELQDASSRLAVAAAALRTLQAVVLPSAQQAHEAASRGFEAGKFGVLDVLDAQRSLLQARSRHLDTLAAAHRAAADIDRIVGR